MRFWKSLQKSLKEFAEGSSCQISSCQLGQSEVIWLLLKEIISWRVDHKVFCRHQIIKHFFWWSLNAFEWKTSLLWNYVKHYLIKVKREIVRGTRDKSTNQSDFLIIRVSSNRDFLFALSSSFLRCILKTQIVTGFLHLFQNPYLFVTTMQIFA